MAGFDDNATEKTGQAEGSDVGSFDELMSKTREAKGDIEGQKLDIGVYGKPKTGKTHFALSAPGPIFFIDTEGGTGPLEHKFADDKDIAIHTIKKVGDDYSQDHVKAWEEFQETVNMLLENQDKFETVVVDSTTDIWNYVRNYCKVKIWNKSPEERLDQQWDWGEINSRYTNTVQKLLGADFHVIFTARSKQEYAAAGEPTGNYDPKWQKRTTHWLNVVVQNQKSWQDGGTTKRLFSTIEHSRFDYDGDKTIMGTEIENMEWDDLLTEIKKVAE